MECPQCKREVETLHGNGTYPNSTYRCSKCYDDDMGKIVSGLIAIILWGTFIILCISQI